MPHLVAQGTFGLLYFGRIHYLREAAVTGNWLTVIVTRQKNVSQKQLLALPDSAPRHNRRARSDRQGTS